MVGKTELRKKKEEDRRSVFENDISVDSYYAFLGYSPLSKTDCIKEVSIIQLACLDAGTGNVRTCLTKRSRRGKHR